MAKPSSQLPFIYLDLLDIECYLMSYLMRKVMLVDGGLPNPSQVCVIALRPLSTNIL